MPLPNTRKSISTGACRARHCAGTTSRRPNALHTMPMPGNPRGRTIRHGSPGSEEGRRRASSMVTDVPATHRTTTLLVRRWDAGPPRRPRRPGLRAGSGRIRDRDRSRDRDRDRSRDSNRNRSRPGGARCAYISSGIGMPSNSSRSTPISSTKRVKTARRRARTDPSSSGTTGFEW